MKKTLLILTSLIILAGCTWGKKPAEPQVAEPTPAVPAEPAAPVAPAGSVTTSVTVTEPEGGVAEEAAEKNAAEEPPAARPGMPVPQAPAPSLPEAAQQPQMTCDMLKDAGLKTDCKELVKGMIRDALFSEITSTFALDRCPELVDPGIVKNCQDKINKTGVTEPVSAEEAKKLEAATSGTDKAACDQMATPELKAHCEGKVEARVSEMTLDEILTSGDVTRCAELSGDEKSLCESLLKR